MVLDNVDSDTAENFRQSVQKVRKSEQRDSAGGIELDEDVDVAVRAGLAAGEGPEEGEGASGNSRWRAG